MPQNRPAQSAPLLLALWSRLLYSSLPWAGPRLQRLAAAKLGQAAHRGDLTAASRLAAALDHPQTAGLTQFLHQILEPALPPQVLDRLWEDWATLRAPQLAEWLVRSGVTARPQSPAWLHSQAALKRLGVLKSAAPARVAALAALCADPDPQLAAAGHEALSALSQPESRDELVRLWAESRSEWLWAVIRTAGYIPTAPPAVQATYFLKAGDTAAVLHASAGLVPGLAAALTDPDPQISSQARRCLPQLQDEQAVNALAEIWQQQRSSLIKEILHQGGLLATQPYPLRLLTMLVSNPGLAVQTVAEGIPILVQALRDRDPQIAAAARTTCLNLAQVQSQAALCQFAVEHNHPDAFSLALQADYRPTQPQQRALFIFMAGLWDEYNQLDFDHRLLQFVYSTAPSELRQRIALQIQRSGQTAYLDILTGPDLRSRAGQLSQDEIDLSAQLLVANQEWPRLWTYLHTFSLPWSIRVLQALQAAKWQPDQPAECSEYAQLISLAEHLPLPSPSLSQALPPALLGATVKVQGRVNDVCFAPHQSLIAIGTGSRKLALWDFQSAALKQVRQGFNHSISRVAFAGSDYLLCGVRSNTDAACLIYGWQGEEAFVLPGHVGAVTALLPLAENRLLSTGRDGQVILWNLAARQETQRHFVGEWPRSALLLPDANQVALLHTSITLLQLPTLAEASLQPFWTQSHSNTQRSIAQSAFFPPDQPGFLLGQRNGQLVQCAPSRTGQKIVRKAILRESAPIVELTYLNRQRILVVALQNGWINFYRWPKMHLLGTVLTPQGQLTSLHVSPNSAFMATGTNASTMLLWDLRVLDVPALLELPLSQATPDHLAALTSLLRQSLVLPAPLVQSLELLKALLIRRFRFDIQIDELAQIQPGEFDILLD